MIDNPLFYCVAIPAVFFNSLSKGGFGGALGGIAVPMLSLVIAPPQAAAIMLPLLCAADLIGIRRYSRFLALPHLLVMLVGGCMGVAFGTVAFGSFSDNTLRLLIGVIAVCFSVYYFLAPQANARDNNASWPKGLFWGALSGYTSFVAHAGGPPAMTYLLAKRLDRAVYVATINAFFLVLNLLKVLPYVMLGQFTDATLTTSATLLPLVPLGVFGGFWLQGKINNRLFYRIAQIFLFISGLQLLIMAIY